MLKEKRCGGRPTESTIRAAAVKGTGALAASDTAGVRVPSFETLLELDGYLTGCYNGYRAELRAFDLTFPLCHNRSRLNRGV